MKTSARKKVLIGLSGGIDSAVSAYLLKKAGYEVEAAFMKNWSQTKGLKYDECPWLADRQDALRVAAFLKIPMHTLDFERQYEKEVLGYFFSEYKAGRTPNPDVMCNKEIKFKLLYNWAMDHGFDYLATGHYAQVQVLSNKKQVIRKASDYNLKPKTYNLARSKDEFKDQTYFIYNIRTEQLPHVLFPIGHLKKVDVRTLAQKFKLPNAGKKESMGLCFVGHIRLKDFLEQQLKPKAGPIVDKDGKKIGEHEGLYAYTIGQRQGIKVGSGGPYYVLRKDLKSNTLVVTNNPDDPQLEIKEIEIHSVNWITLPLTYPAQLKGRYRHQGTLVDMVIKPVKRGSDKRNHIDQHYQVEFKKPQKAIASGQSLVLYDKKICLGGGVIV
jgi:tRNA-uridine 2-sulfurtransferase